MNFLLVLMIGAVVVGLLPRLDQRKVSPIILLLAFVVATLFFLSSRGR